MVGVRRMHYPEDGDGPCRTPLTVQPMRFPTSYGSPPSDHAPSLRSKESVNVGSRRKPPPTGGGQ